MKPNFAEMSKAEVKAYVLEHRDDIEAIRNLFSRRTPGFEGKRYPPLCTKDGVPIPENIRIMQEAILKRIEEVEKEKKESQE